MKLSIRQFTNYIIIFTIFSGGLSLTRFFGFANFRIIYVLVPLILLLWIPFLRNTYFDESFLWFYSIFAIIIFLSIINIFLGNNSFLLLSKQVAGILLTSLAFFLLFKINKYDVKKLFKIYLNAAFLVAFIGLVQVVSFLLNFELGYDFNYLFPRAGVALTRTGFIRVNSILTEPDNFACVLIPAFFASIVALTQKKYALLKTWQSIIILIVFFLTFSTSGYIGFFLALALLIYNYGKVKYLIFFGLVLSLFTFFLWNNLEEVKMRVNDSWDVVTGEKKVEKVNLSTFSLFSNALVSYRVFKNSPLIGEGLGSRPMSYDKHIEEVVDVNRIRMFLNREGGNSLAIRILSEMGLLGIILFFYFLFKFYLSKRKDKTDYLWMISNAVLVMFLMRVVKGEHYFAEGLFFFFWLYYFTWKSNRKINKKTPTNKT